MANGVFVGAQRRFYWNVDAKVGQAAQIIRTMCNSCNWGLPAGRLTQRIRLLRNPKPCMPQWCREQSTREHRRTR